MENSIINTEENNITCMLYTYIYTMHRCFSCFVYILVYNMPNSLFTELDKILKKQNKEGAVYIQLNNNIFQ